MPTLPETMAFVRAVFADVVDLGGAPYADHCVRVMSYLPVAMSDDECHAALLHDVLRNRGVTTDDLVDLGYSARTVWLVGMLTRPPHIAYLDYIRMLKATGDAGLIAIKIADNADNTDPMRVARLPVPRPDLIKRYIAARAILIGMQ